MIALAPELVAEVKALSDGGLSIRAIANALNDAGVLSATGKKWHIRTVQIALQQARDHEEDQIDRDPDHTDPAGSTGP